MKRIATMIVVVLILTIQFVFAGKATWQQYFYVVQKIFPQTNEINILLPDEEQLSQKNLIARAAAQFHFKVKLYLVTDVRSIGANFKLMPDNSVLIVYDSPLIQDKISMMYILSRSREKNISVVSSSQQYTESGALVGLLRDEKGHLRVVINLKFSPSLASRFTPEFNQKVGITKVLQ